ncbi:MAG: ABC transporter permease [Oligoflexia bacterium]|nr:ABC transporter permease [Oligoflexia bacterium]
MLVFFVRKCFTIIATLFVLATITFFLLRVVPGGPFDSDKALPPDIKANVEAKFGLNKPLWEQYGSYLWGISRFDFGPSFKYMGRNVTEIILDTLPTSMELGVYSLFLAVILGIPIGVLSAYKQNTWVDFSSMFLAVAGISLPSYFVGAILIYFFALHWNLLPPALWEEWVHKILPTITLGTRPASLIARLTRAALLESIRSDYVRTARAKGVSEFKVVVKHALRNSLIPVVTLLGPLAAFILTGTFVIEYIFAIPGMGKYFIDAVTNRDYPLVMGVTMIFGFMLVTANLLVDIAYAIIDPRVRIR